MENFPFTNAVNESFIYTGGMSNGSPNGQGKGVYYEDDLVYEGSWKDGQPDGYGKVVHSKSAFSYQGNWKDSTWTQSGTFQFGTDSVEVTHVENYLISKWPTGPYQCSLQEPPFLYTGQISSKGVPFGNGTARYFKEDSKFLRKTCLLWKSCNTNGPSEIYFRDSDEYKGYTADGKFSDTKGRYKVSGVEYIGQYVNDIATGVHQAIYPNGTIGYVKAEPASLGTWNFVPCPGNCE